MKNNLPEVFFSGYKKDLKLIKRPGFLHCLFLLTVLLFAVRGSAQRYTQANSYATATYGGETVTVGVSGPVYNFTLCGTTGPFFIWNGGSSVTWTFSHPVASVRVPLVFAGYGPFQSTHFTVNGSSYTLTSANMKGLAGGCSDGVNAVLVSGDITNTGDEPHFPSQIIDIPGPITSITIQNNGGAANAAVAVPMFFEIPSVNSGNAQTLTVCQNAPATSTDAKLGASGGTGTYTWSVVTPPAHGTLGGFNATAAAGTNVTPSGTTYTPTTGYSGSDSYVINISDGTNSSNVTMNITVTPFAGAISGAATVCQGGATTFTNPAAGGTWSSSTSSIATVGTGSGVVSGVAGGTATITYGTGCGTNTTKTISVTPIPSAITGNTPICQTGSVTLANAAPGGVWTSGGFSVATVATLSGVVSGVSGGTATISYSNGCGSSATTVVTVIPTPAVVSNTGNAVCSGTSSSVSAVPSAGAVINWYSTSAGSTFLATGNTLSIPTATVTAIYYAQAASGGGLCLSSPRAATTLTVNPVPAAISGTAVVCAGSTTALSDATSGGTWSSSNIAVAGVISGSGVVSGLTAGTVTISYTLPAGCFVTQTVTVNPLPAAIAGVMSACMSATSALSDATASGAWSTTTSAVATVNSSTGVVAGVTAGTTTISYTLPGTGCATTGIFTVNPMPAAITGSANVCVTNITTLSDATTGGVWSSSNMSAATVASGVVSGVTPGTANISYTLSAGCSATLSVTVNALPVIGGGANVTICNGTSTTLGATGGTTYSWSPATGLSCTTCASPVASPTVTTTYTVTGTGTGTTGSLTTYNQSFNQGVTPTTQCSAWTAYCASLTGTYSGFTIKGSQNSTGYTCTDPAVAMAIANALRTGIATTQVSDGHTWFVGTGCGSGCAGSGGPTVELAVDQGTCACGSIFSLRPAINNTNWGGFGSTCSATSQSIELDFVTLAPGCPNTATVTVSVNPLPPAITGTKTVCESATATLTDATGPGNWSSSSASTATIGSASGIVTGVAAGTTTISYTLNTGCYATSVVTVNPVPDAITGTASTCAGLTTTLSDATASGLWSSGTTTIATVNSSTGVVTGTTAGSSAISYTLATGCYATQAVTVNPLPAAITGTMSACIGATSVLSDAITSGTWSSSTPAVATVNPSTGVVTGVTAGTTTISYTLSGTGCVTTSVFTVNSLPAAITGTLNTCPGSTTSLADASAFGNWSSSDLAVATVGAGTGIVSGIAAGTATVTYMLSTGCIVTAPVTVNPSPASITGTAIVCAGLTTALSDVTTSGTWSSSNTAVAAIDGAGTVTGLLAGTSVITYTSSASGCIVLVTVTVNSTPAAISGAGSVCTGSSVTLSNTTGGGTWSANNGNVSVASNVITGNTAGTSVISYILPAGCYATTTMTVNAAPAAIAGPDNVCASNTISLSDATTGGVWSSSDMSAATVTGGVVSGVTPGTANISYTLSAGCSAILSITVNALPVISGGANVTICNGTSTTLGATGGTTYSWSPSAGLSCTTCANPVAAPTVTTTYTVTGTASGGILTYNQSFTQSVVATTQCSAWTAYCASLTGTYSGFTVKGSLNTTGYTCTDPAVATAIANALRTGIATTQVSDGHTWFVGTGCGSGCAGSGGPTVELAVDQGTCACGSIFSLRPAINNTNWGGFGGTCSATSQSIELDFVTASFGNCSNTATVTVSVNPLPSAITGTNVVCESATTILADATSFGNWSSSSVSTATIGTASGTVTGVAAGTTTISYTLNTGCYATSVVTVNPAPGAITGSPVVCTGLTTNLTDASGTGTWSSSNTAAATVDAGTGIVTGIAPGYPSISYTLPTGCFAATTVTVNPLPSAITGTMSACIGATAALSDAVSSGTWSSSDAAVATINSATGIVTGVTAGTTTITYTLSGTGCVTTSVFTVNPFPAAITGTLNTCPGSTTSLADASAFGTWSSSDLTIASVGTGTGIVSGIAAGTATVTYTLSTGCIITAPVTVNPLPASVTGTTMVCPGLTTTLSDVATPGTWSSSNITVATVAAGTGVVTGIVPGTAIITYTLGTGCITMATVTVNPLPAAIGGPSAVCAGLNITLNDATPSGSWSSSSTAVATVNSSTGVVTGVSAGTATVTYTLPVSGCIMTKVITVNPLPAAITGITNVCAGLTTTLSDAGGGTWMSGNLSLATVGASSGIVTGLAAGALDITYTLATGCIITTPVTVNPLPAAITGTINVCAGLTTALADAAGGAWSSGATAIATVDAAGIVTGVSAGTAAITYTLPTGCITTAVVTVNPLPAAITGLNNVCSGLTTLLADPTGFGSWSSSNTAAAAINSATGLVTGIAAGTTTITYTLATGCISTLTFTVNPLPAAITGNAVVCQGLTTTLTDAGGGTWSSSNTAVAAIASSTGVMTGVAAGNAIITYTLPTGCITLITATVNPLPAAITGAATHVCAGLTITMSDATPSGTWSSSTANATVNSTTGVVTGVTAGTTTLTYTLPTGCIMTTVITVDPLPAAITGTMNVCAGLTTALSDATPSGTWSSSNATIASIDGTTGIVSGLVSGTATMTYTLPTGCIMTTVLTVNPLPAAITGTMDVCAGLTTALSDATPSGTWSSSNATIASIDGTTGLVSGLVSGTATMTYTLPTGCIMTTVLTVNPLPAAITGTMDVCAGLTTALSDATPSGTWSSSNATVATIDGTTGLASGLAAGTATMTYTLPTGCIMTTILTVNPLPAAITGTMDVCAGLTTVLSDATPSGTWSSSDAGIASVASGIVTGVMAGTATVTYTLPTGCVMTTVITVNPLPAAITGNMHVCAGLTTALSDATPSGVWSNDLSPLTTAIIINSATGLVTGITAGTNTVTYMLSTGCIVTTVVTVDPLPIAIAGNMHVCAGLTTALTDASTGGTWTSGSTNATIDMATGVVSGVTAGTSLITYTLPTGCIITTIVTVDPLPAAITGTMHACAGLTTTLSNSSAGGMWSTADPAVATINTANGIVTGITAGTTTVTYMLPTGCIMTAVVTVDPLPTAITGTMQVCAGSTASLSNGASGGTWTSDNTSVASIDGTTGIVTGIAAGTATVTYTLPTGCIMSTTVTVNPLPSAITGIMNVCVGSTDTLTDVGGGSWFSSDAAIATVNDGVVTGIDSGNVTITYVLPTGCIATAAFRVNAMPDVFAVTGGGAYCPGGVGVHILLGSSASGINYQLYNDATSIGAPSAGTGLIIDFGPQTDTGTYTVVATDPATFCTSNMAASATVSLYPLPAVHTVTGGGSYCTGGTGVHIGMDTADAGINYQLYEAGVTAGAAIAGSNTTLDFGLYTVADTYTVTGIDAITGCSIMMSGNAIVTINAIVTPSVNITYTYFGDTICAGTPITFTANPVNGGTVPAYVWQVNSVVKDTTNTYTYTPANGDTVTAMLTGNAVCSSPDTASASVIVPVVSLSLPSVVISSNHGDTVCGGNVITYTAAVQFGGSAPVMTWVVNGRAVDSGVTYAYLPKDGDIVYNTLLSNYRCRDTNRVFSNNIIMTVDSPVVPTVTITADPGITLKPVLSGLGATATFTAIVTDGGSAPTYQWYLNAAPVTGATNVTFTGSRLADNDSISVRVQRTDACANVTFNGVIIHISGLSVQHVSSNEANVSVIPNPNKGAFTVKGSLGVSDDVNVSLELTDMLGQVVYRNNVPAKSGNLDVQVKLNNTLANGMYLLNVRSEAVTKVFHVVVEQ